jgi:hypothetical protein
MGVTEEAGKVGTAAVNAMGGSPLAIALLLVNIGFLVFAGFVLGQVASNASERNKTQADLISRLADDLKDCRVMPPPKASLDLDNPLMRVWPFPVKD